MRALKMMEVCVVSGGVDDIEINAGGSGGGFCGPSDYPSIAAFVPELWFTADCEIHDQEVAAQNPGADDNFLANMQDTCDDLNGPEYLLCNVAAYVYYGVAAATGPLFQP